MIEKYAFITNNNYDEHAQIMWPNAISVGANYKMVQFADINEARLEVWVDSLGGDCKVLSASAMIAEMELVLDGPFNSNYANAADVLYYFNPAPEEP